MVKYTKEYEDTQSMDAHVYLTSSLQQYLTYTVREKVVFIYNSNGWAKINPFSGFILVFISLGMYFLNDYLKCFEIVPFDFWTLKTYI